MGIKVKDVEGTELEVAPDEAMQGLAAGRFQLAEERVRVLRGDNGTGYVSATDAPKAFAQGWRLGTEEEASQAKLRREASSASGVVKHGTLAAARGASLGLTDIAATATGLASAEELQAGQDALGEAATGLEIAGAVAASVATGGGGAAAQGAGRAGLAGAAGVARGLARKGLGAIAAPTKYATRLGTAVERAVLGGAEAAELTVGRRALGAAAGGAAEGVLEGLGGVVSESVIHDKPLTAEALVGGALAGAAFGGAISGGASYAGGTIGRVLRGLHPRSGKPVSDEALRDVLGRDAGIDPAEVPDQLVAAARADGGSTLGDIAERVAPWSGADPAVAKRVFTAVERDPKRVQDLLARKTQIEQEVGETLQAKLTTVQGTLETARMRAQGEGKYASLAGKLPANADYVAPRLTDSIRSKINALTESWKLRNVQHGHRAYDPGTLLELDKLKLRLEAESRLPGEGEKVRNARGQFVKAPQPDPGDMSMARFRALDRFKRDLDVLIGKTGGWGSPPPGTMLDVVTINKEMRDMHREIRDHLEREDLWGGAGTQQRELNASYARAARASDEFRGLATGSGLRGLVDPGTPISLRQAMTVARQFRRMGGSEVVDKLNEVLDRQLEHLDVIRTHYDLGREELNAIQHAHDAVREIRDRLATQADDAAFLDDLEMLREAESARSVSMGALSSVGPAAGALVGAGVAGPIGAAAGLVAGGVFRPYTTARTMASLLSTAKRFGMKFDGKTLVAKLRASYGTAKTKAKAAKDEVVRRLEAAKVPQRATATARGLKLGIAFQLGQLSAEDKAQGIEKMQQQLALLSDPDELEKILGPEFEVFSLDAPETATAVQETVGRLVAFLQGSVPPIYRDEFTGRPPLVSSAEADRFLRRARAALDPRSVVRSFLDGTVTTDEVQALRAVYPATFEAMAQGAQEAVMAAAERDDPIPYQGRVKLSILLGQPLEPLLRPKAMQRLQALHARPDQQPATGAAPAPVPSPRSGRGIKTTGSVEAITTLGTASQRTGTRAQR